MTGNKSKLAILVFALFAVSASIAGCASKADIASQALSRDADQFKIERRVVFYNGITGDYILSIEGKCSLGNYDDSGEVTITCKTGEDQYKKHFLGLSDNVTYFAEQIESSSADAYHYKVVFRPSTIIPNVEVDLP